MRRLWPLLMLGSWACVELPVLSTPIRLPGAESALVVADHGAGAPDRFEAYAVRVDKESGNLLDFRMVTSATTVSFVGYPCPLERYGWTPGALTSNEDEGRRLPPNAHSALRLLGQDLEKVTPPRSLAGLSADIQVEQLEAPSVRAFHGGETANVRGGLARVVPLDEAKAALFVADWGAVVFGTEDSVGATPLSTVYFDAFGMTGFDGLVGLTGGAPSALVFIDDAFVLRFALSDRPALRGLTGGFESEGAAYYSIDIGRRELVRMTDDGALARTETFATGLPAYQSSVRLVWVGPGRIFVVNAGYAPIEVTKGHLRTRGDLPRNQLRSGDGWIFAVDGGRGVEWNGQDPPVEWDCPLPVAPVAAAVDSRESAVAGAEELYLRTHGVCGRCRKLSPIPPVASILDVAFFPDYLFVLQNAFSANFAITTWIDRPAD